MAFTLYSEKFDRELEDIFAIQDEISLAILNAIQIKLFGAEKEAVLKEIHR
jgi:adenylate cyclase